MNCERGTVDLPAICLPYQDEIDARIAGGWHPVRIARTLQKQYGISVSPMEIAQHAMGKPVEPSPLKKMAGNQDIISDPVADLHLLIRSEQERVAMLIQAEKEDGKPSPSNNIYLNTLFRHMKELAELEFQLGISPYTTQQQPTNMQPQATKTLQQIIEETQANKVTLREVTVERG